MNRKYLWIVGLVWLLAIFACTRSATGTGSWRAAPKQQGGQVAGNAVASNNATHTPYGQAKRAPGEPILTPTPDTARVLPTPRLEPDEYLVQPNDSLGMIAQHYGVSLDSLIQANELINPNQLEVGQILKIPAGKPMPSGPGFKILPDSELVYGPGSADFDVSAFVKSQKGYLSRYQEDINNRSYDGAGVVLRVAQEYSVNPRILLAVLEYRSGWVTQADPSDESKTYPMLYNDGIRKGLYRQMAWAANNLNRGYYLWRVGAVASWILSDGSVVPVNPTINLGTAGVQQLFALLLGYDDWQKAVSETGVFMTFNHLFGYPFDYAFDPILPDNLTQPPMQLPFEPGDVWSFTGGPHAGWADGSAWAAIDFAPPGEALGCVQSDSWEVAVADGIIVRSDQGAVVEDLDGDGLEQTGWTVLYMHVENRDRIAAGTQVKAGDKIGHPSCEGGVSTGTHLHLARRYNGEWISADGSLPFNLDGWISKGDGVEYNGFLVKDGNSVEAWEGRRSENAISR